jgi:hypothetical protein
MAYPTARSCNRELAQGSIDGTYKQANRDRGGVIEGTTLRARRDLDDTWYGIHEVAVKETPDGLKATTPTYAPTPPAHLC